MAKETKQLRKAAKTAERYAKVAPDREFAGRLSTLAAAFRAQVAVMKAKKKAKPKKKKPEKRRPKKKRKK